VSHSAIRSNSVMTTGVPVKSRNRRPGNNMSWRYEARPALSGGRREKLFVLFTRASSSEYVPCLQKDATGIKRKLFSNLSGKLESSFSERG
jgi:hypothetical protein